MAKRGRPRKNQETINQLNDFIKKSEDFLKNVEEADDEEMRDEYEDDYEDDFEDDYVEEGINEEEGSDEVREKEEAKRSEYSYNEEKKRYNENYDIGVEWNEAEDANDVDEEDDEIIDKDRPVEEEREVDTSYYHPYLVLLQGANIVLTKIVQKDLKFDNDEMDYLNELFWRAYPDVTDKMNPKMILLLTLGQIYASKLLV